MRYNFISLNFQNRQNEIMYCLGISIHKEKQGGDSQKIKDGQSLWSEEGLNTIWRYHAQASKVSVP